MASAMEDGCSDLQGYRILSPRASNTQAGESNQTAYLYRHGVLKGKAYMRPLWDPKPGFLWWRPETTKI